MSESTDSPPQARAVLRCRSAGVPALQNEAAARWILRHVAFNSGFEQRPTAGDPWTRSRRGRHAVPGFELNLDLRDGRFMLRASPVQRRLDLHILLGPGAQHLHGNLSRLVDDFATACLAEVESVDLLAGEPAAPMRETATEPLVLPA